ncbi:hypothetical protein ACW14Y_42245 [Kitasatospora sp. cg17-2]
MSIDVHTVPATMPDALRRMLRHFTMEVLNHLTEVVTHTLEDSTDWMRMPSYRLTDAADTLNLAATGFGAYLREIGVDDHDIASYLQVGQQRPRAVDSPAGRDFLDGFLDRPGGEGTSMRAVAEIVRACVDDDDPTAPDKYGDVEALLYAFRFARSEDAEEWFEDLQPAVADRARRIAAILAEGTPSAGS